MRPIIGGFIFVGLSLFAAQALAVPTYRLTDLGTLGEGAVPLAISDTGLVSGESWTGSGTLAFIWDSVRGMRSIGDLPGGWELSNGHGVNNSGVVAGRAWGENSNNAFRWTEDTGMVSLGGFPGQSAREAFARGINNQGQIVGNAHLRRGAIGFDLHAFLWSEESGMIDLGTFPGGRNSTAYGINDLGQVVGESWTQTGGGLQAFAWTSDTGLKPLGDTSDGLTRTIAYSINEHGDAVGVGRDAFGDVAVIWRGGGAGEVLPTLRPLPPDDDTTTNGQIPPGTVQSPPGPPPFSPYSSAKDINNDRLVVGIINETGNESAALWDADGERHYLTELLAEPYAGWTLTTATAINNVGQITATAIAPDGSQRGVVLTPIPEPAAGASLVAMLFSVALTSRLFHRRRVRC
jgi:probable HAF family extracellular repeat protein